MEDKIMEDKIDVLLQQNEENIKTSSEKRKELEGVLLQLRENLDKNFEKVALELREMLQKIPYSREFTLETLKKDIYELRILSYRGKVEDNYISIYKGDICLFKVYKYKEHIHINPYNKDVCLNTKVFLLQNLEEVKAMLLRLLYSVVNNNEKSRKYELEKLETEIRLLKGVVTQDVEEKQWSDYISYVLVWCSENQHKTEDSILSFDEWKHKE